MEQIIYLPTKDLRPYKNNPRKNAGAVEAVAASIREYGFRSPIIITEDNTIINGHTRLRAAKKLGITQVPCVRVTDLPEDKIREYRLIDNKTSEYASWDADLLAGEISELDFSGLDFSFDFSGDIKKRDEWERHKTLCDLKDKVAAKRCNEVIYYSLFRTGKTGKTLEEIKANENVQFFAETAAFFLQNTLGRNIGDFGWCILTTPRRRHKEGFHFATEVSRKISLLLNLPFYEDAFESLNTTRLNPEFEMMSSPEEQNVIIYDDVLTTGFTMRETRRLLIEQGYVTYPLVSIDNH